ncbi:ABC transporter permease [Nibrella saemangeumensis]|uniref:ABC transporter permease n=1 Tax=Nibrella saemangeumensis TaxID=1084526 RepID=A0ABP8M9R9_9BACT
MLRNYLTITLRNLWKHKLFSAINIFGLASGMMVCLLAIIHIKGAFDYDNFHPNRHRVYRVLTDVATNEHGVVAHASSPMPLAGALQQDYAFVEQTARVVRVYGEFAEGHKRFNLLSWAVDPGFFTIFSGFQLAQGQAAAEPRTVVLTRETAEKFFGTANPIGRVLQHDELGPLTVTGVLADNPTHSHLKFDLLLSLKTPGNPAYRHLFEDWRQYAVGYTYVMLKPGTMEKALSDALSAINKQTIQGLQFTREKGYSFRTQALTNVSPGLEELAMSTYERQIGGLLVEIGVGLLTLLLAAFNYINLTLARSLSRAREVGIRKVSGALRWQLMGQFMAESVVLSLLALGLAYVMLQFVKPMPFVQQWLIGGVQWDETLWIVFILFSIVTGVLAGIVPARVLSGFQPAQVLRSQTGLRVLRGISLRKSLIVAQFAISMIALIFLLTMGRQQHYMATADYGFRRESVLNIPLNGIPYQRLTHELSQLSGVERVSATSDLFGSFGDSQVFRRQRATSDSMMAFTFAVDHQFVPNMNLSLLAGQNMPVPAADTAGRFVLINEEAVNAFHLGSAREAVGQSLWLNDSTELQIAGVLKDFRFTSFAWSIKPLVLRYQPAQFRYLNVGVAKGAGEAVLADAKAVLKKLTPYEPFTGQWYDDFLYQRHNHREDLDFLSLLTGLALSIACLGLLGMVTYTTETRTKEVGIRKVMGADITQIVALLSWDFVKLLLIASAIALPLGALAGMAFLINFAYHVSIGIETLGVCFLVMLLLGGLTIGWRTYRAASANPVKSLRAE